MKDKIYKITPNFIQNILISLFNLIAYKKRYGGQYKIYKELFYKNRDLSRKQLLNVQKQRFVKFVASSRADSEFYNKLYKSLSASFEIKDIKNLPIVNKEMLRVNIEDVIIDNKESLITSKTGGTTGKSLEIKYRPINMQERFAMLDDFRSRFGYKLGKKTAWFSGKSLLTQRDLKKNRFWKTDYWYKVRYYSTFHIKNEYLQYYVEDLIRFQPEYLVGFPSTMLEIAKYGLKNKYTFPENVIKAIFPTAETITEEVRIPIEQFFKTKMYNQYASSEGAPFIFECEKGNLHLELQSGVFEVLDTQNQPTRSGRLVVTSFTTEATPLIRYDIGDYITLDDPKKTCVCGNNNPMVLEIHGRKDDYVYSPEMGKINLGNISNTLKDTKGIQNFQVVQNSLNQLIINLIVDKVSYSEKMEKKFLSNWKDRIGSKMRIELNYVSEIPVEASGKFRMVKNNIKDKINAQT